jgi:hypothetical protein
MAAGFLCMGGFVGVAGCECSGRMVPGARIELSHADICAAKSSVETGCFEGAARFELKESGLVQLERELNSRTQTFAQQSRLSRPDALKGPLGLN